MQVRGRMRVKSEPCHGCGEVRELIGEYPQWIMLCYPCLGRFICICCGVADYEYNGRPEEYKGDPDEYACPVLSRRLSTRIGRPVPFRSGIG